MIPADQATPFDILLHSETLKTGQAWSALIRRGHTLTLVDKSGDACVAALFYNADCPVERYNMPDTLKAQHIARLTTGNCLYSDMGRVLCSIVEDSCGWHDTITGISNARLTQEKYGVGTYATLRNACYKNSRDNFLVELGKYELGKRDLVPNVNFFVKVAVGDEGELGYVGGNSQVGGRVKLRCDMNLLVVLSNTPHPLDPRAEYAPGVVEIQIHAGDVAADDDKCRTQSDESARAFALNAQYFL
jgi:uncharacterized protein